MRLCSDDKNDPGYAPFQQVLFDGMIALVFLDGEPVKALMADEELCEVRRAVVDREGRIQVSPDNSDEIWIETVTGDVKIVIEDRK